LPTLDEERASSPSAEEFLYLMKNLALEPYRVERAIVVPFDRERHENDAEHSFSLGIVAVCLAPLLDDQLNVPLVSIYALIHDLTEIYAGDTPVYASSEMRASKEDREKAARMELHQRFGVRFPWLARYIDDYVATQDNESKFVYALDKILPHATVILGEYHPARPTLTAYKETELIAREKIAATYPMLLPLFDQLCQRYVRIPSLFSPEQDDASS
jgi:5'-deoxynucleotidase YfbR-like HD superfamily hydrolase